MAEWEAYHFFEPWGAPAEDNRWRQMYSLYYSANSKPGSSMPDWLDHDPEETARLREREQAAETMEDRIEAFFAMFAAKADTVEIDQETPVEAAETTPVATVSYIAPAPYDQTMTPTS